MSIQVFGLPVSRGVAIGRAVLVASSRVDVAHYFIDPAQAAAEIDRLRQARDLVAHELTTLKHELPADAPGELAALLDVHLMLLHDETLAEATKHWIEQRHYNAEWAISAQTEVLARQFDEMEDEYLRERKADIEQVAERLLGALASRSVRSVQLAPFHSQVSRCELLAVNPPNNTTASRTESYANPAYERPLGPPAPLERRFQLVPSQRHRSLR